MIAPLVPAHILCSTRKDHRVERFGRFDIQPGFAAWQKEITRGILVVFCFRAVPVRTLLSCCGGGSFG